MAEVQNQDATKRSIEDSVEENPAGFRAESLDGSPSEDECRVSKYLFIDKLLRFVTEYCLRIEHSGCLEAWTFFRSMDDPNMVCPDECPEVKVSRMLALHEELALWYLSESVESFPEEVASTFELLEASRFERRNPRDRLARGSRLKHFRMAQSIRNKHGISRRNSAKQCFDSIEDIAKLEEELAQDDPVEFMLQCVALSEDVSIDNMYGCTNTHRQLASFHREISRMGRVSQDCVYAYAGHFEDLSFGGENIPTWSELESYLNLPFPLFSPEIGHLFRVDVPREKLDEALNVVLNHLVQCFRPLTRRQLLGASPESQDILPRYVNAVVNGLLLLLERGANLMFSAPHESVQSHQSSLGALVELLELVPSFPMAELAPYICCPLIWKGNRLEFASFRPAPLSCLAARKVPIATPSSRIPERLRCWLKMHQILQGQVGYYRTAACCDWR